MYLGFICGLLKFGSGTVVSIVLGLDPVLLKGWRHFVSFTIALLPMLRSLNGLEVTPEQRDTATEQWRRLRRLYQIAAGTLHVRHAIQPATHAMRILRESDAAPAPKAIKLPKRPASAAPTIGGGGAGASSKPAAGALGTPPAVVVVYRS